MNKYKAYLRKRPHYGEMINEIELHPPKIKYPDRTATFLRNTQYMSRFDGDQSFINLEEQEQNMAKEQLLQQELRNMARTQGTTHALLQATSRHSTPRYASSSASSDDSNVQQIRNQQAFYFGGDWNSDTISDIDSEQRRREVQENAKRFFLNKRARQNLQALTRATDSDFMQFATPRADASSGSEYEEQASFSTSHGGYRRRPVQQMVQEYEQQSRRRMTKKTPPPSKR